MRKLLSPIKAVDLFCGAAGLSLGLKESGIQIAAGIDLDPACRFPFEENIGAKFLEQDVATLESSTVHALFGKAKVRVLAGCAPCQPFSAAGRQRGGDDPKDMWPHAVRAVRAIKPRAFLFENVANLLARKFAAYRRDVILGPLRRLGYNVDMRLLVCADYGVPQTRPRVFTVGVRDGIQWESPAPTHAKDALLAAQWIDG